MPTKLKVVKHSQSRANSDRRSKVPEECLELFNAINRIPGICALQAISGDGETPFVILVAPEEEGVWDSFPDLLYWMNGCHTRLNGWYAEIYTDCARFGVHCRIVGPVGEQAYREARVIAGHIHAMFDGESEKECLQ